MTNLPWSVGSRYLRFGVDKPDRGWVLAIDPGNTHSGWVVIDGDTYRPVAFDKTENPELHRAIRAGNFLDCHHVTIEMIASYGMPVGAEVFDTCVWIGRLSEALTVAQPIADVDLVKRLTVKQHHCHDSRAKDSNIRQALVDRFTPGQPNHGKGTKKNPGWFHGFHSDIWAAYALAVYAADTLNTPHPNGPHAHHVRAGDTP